MKRVAVAALGLLVAMSAPVPVTHADSISGVVGARAKERAGARLSEHDIENLERYGSNDSHHRYRYGYPVYGYPAYSSYGYEPYYDGYGYGGIGIGGVGIGFGF